MAGGGSSDGDYGLQIAPMLDVMFVLLLFFMVMAGKQVKEAELGVQVPAASTVATVKSPVKMEVSPEGLVTFNGSPVDVRDDEQMPKLRAKLKALIEVSPEQSVIIRPKDQAPYQSVINILNACAAERVKNLTFGN